ncbi:MAG: hypothetical protein IJA17_08005, partial [Oscillospiraceae bacterium]|nr:hypothetical protein [Oscillospiraceae bacterium]
AIGECYWFTSSRASDAMVIFSAPSRGQQVLTLLGSEQTTSLLVVMIISRKAKNKEKIRLDTY